MRAREVRVAEVFVGEVPVGEARVGERVGEVTRILERIDAGEQGATDRLLPLVYDELRRLARARLDRDHAEHSLQATALVHEAYLRLTGGAPLAWNSRGHFFGAAAEAMRRILIERARARRAQKRGGGEVGVPLEEADRAGRLDVIDHPAARDDDKLMRLDHALSRFEEMDATKAQLVKLRYFAGLTLPEAASALGVSKSTADRYWAYARAWLQTEMRGEDS